MKKTPLTSLVLLAVLFLGGGCATATVNTGKAFDSTKVHQIEKAVTTRAELIAWFGEPISRSIDSQGLEKLVWQVGTIESKAQSMIVSMKVKTEMQGKRLEVSVKDGIVLHYAFSEGPMAPYQP